MLEDYSLEKQILPGDTCAYSLKKQKYFSPILMLYKILLV